MMPLSKDNRRWNTVDFASLPRAGYATFSQMVAIASVAVLVDDSAAQLFSFCGLHTVSFLLLVFLKPFANR